MSDPAGRGRYAQPLILLPLALLLSCPTPQGPDGVETLPPAVIGLTDPLWALPPDFPFTAEWLGDFEGAFPGSAWSVSGERSALVAAPGEGMGASQAARFDALSLPGQGGAVSLSRSLSLQSAANLRFWLRTDIGDDVDTAFSFSLDGRSLGSWNGLDGRWLSFDFLIPAGTHSLSWTLTRGSNTYYAGAANAVWLDEASHCPDEARWVQVEPGAPQEVPEGASIAYAARARRGDGSLMPALPVSWEIVPGSGAASVAADGILTAMAAGELGLRAQVAGIPSAASPLTILPADWLERAFVHGGVSYQGKTSVGTGTPRTASPDPDLRVSLPATGSFTADAFFTLKGSVGGSGDSRYALLRLVKLDALGADTPETTSFFLGGDFTRRIWLRFGAGEYRASLHPMTLTADNLGYEGDITGYSYGPAAWSFLVTNTRDEDGRSIYPSDPLQADDLAIRNLAARLLLHAAGGEARLRALHDFVVTSLYYDDDSLLAGRRKKQDALSALANGTGVCEGYTSLFGALARAAGFRVQAVAGAAGEGVTGADPPNHAWNLVYHDGAWPMVDCTWDDPGPHDDDPASLRWDYFLVPGPDGISGDHAMTDPRAGRALGGPRPAPFGAWPPGYY